MLTVDSSRTQRAPDLGYGLSMRMAERIQSTSCGMYACTFYHNLSLREALTTDCVRFQVLSWCEGPGAHSIRDAVGGAPRATGAGGAGSADAVCPATKGAAAASSGPSAAASPAARPAAGNAAGSAGCGFGSYSGSGSGCGPGSACSGGGPGPIGATVAAGSAAATPSTAASGKRATQTAAAGDTATSTPTTASTTPGSEWAGWITCRAATKTQAEAGLSCCAIQCRRCCASGAARGCAPAASTARTAGATPGTAAATTPSCAATATVQPLRKLTDAGLLWRDGRFRSCAQHLNLLDWVCIAN